MKKKLIAAIAGSLMLCLAAAGCGSQTGTNEAAADTSTAEEVSAAATTAAAEIAEEEQPWKEEDDAYLSGLKAADYVDLPKKYDRLEVEAAKPVDPTDEEVDAYIEQELSNRTTLEESDHKHVREGDTVNIDFVGKIDGKEFDGGKGNYDLKIGSHSFIDGFEEGLIGVAKGDTVDLNLTFPENYSATDLAGKPVVFTVTVNKISKSVTPKLTDEFVKSLNLTNSFGQAVTTVNDYKEYIKSNMIEEREATYENTVKSEIVGKIVEDSNFKQDLPTNLVEKYNYLLTRQLNYYALQSYTDLPTLMSMYYGATEDNYKEMIHDMAVYYAKQGLAFQAVADAEKLNPDEDEVSKAVADYVDRDATVESPEDVDRLIRESLRDELMTDKVIGWLYERCKVEEPKEEEKQDSSNEDAAAGTTEKAAAETTEEAAAETTEEAAAETTEEAAAETTEEAAAETTEEAAAETTEEASAETTEEAAAESTGEAAAEDSE